VSWNDKRLYYNGAVWAGTAPFQPDGAVDVRFEREVWDPERRKFRPGLVVMQFAQHEWERVFTHYCTKRATARRYAHVWLMMNVPGYRDELAGDEK
jgi:hypothetical protein